MKSTLLILSLFCASFVLAQQLPPEDRINGAETLKAFTSAKAVMKQSTVKMLDGDGLLLAWGTAVKKDQILTKASALLDATGLQVELPNGKKVTPKQIPRVDRNDLVLFEVPGASLKPITFVPSEEIKQGTWLVSSSSTEAGIMAGVLAADRRDIKRQSGVIGVYLGADGKEVGGIKVQSVAPQGGAEAAGLQTGDIITSVNGIKVVKRADLQKELGKLDPGSVVAVKAIRDEESRDFKVRLGHRGHVFGLFNKNQIMSGVTSRRKTGYTGVLQHDIPLPANELGGPMLTVKGECIGINIARINRSENFALPTEVVQMFLTATEPPPEVAAVDEPKSSDPEPKDPKVAKQDPPAADPVPEMKPDKPELDPKTQTPDPVPETTAEEPVKDPMLDVDGQMIPAYDLVP